jgi:N-ethylmaleimide reductase
MTSPLFTSGRIGGRQAPHRVVMAPMTRARSTQPGDVPNAMNARYYAQRASAALIVSEATRFHPKARATRSRRASTASSRSRDGVW